MEQRNVLKLSDFYVKYIDATKKANSFEMHSQVTQLFTSLGLTDTEASIQADRSVRFTNLASERILKRTKTKETEKTNETEIIQIQKWWRLHKLNSKEMNENRAYLKNLSELYYDIMMHKGASKLEEAFITQLNSKETYSHCAKYQKTLSMIKQKQKMKIDSTPLFIRWINKVLTLDIDTSLSILPLLRNGQILCQLITTLYGLQCHLLQKSDEATVHKLVFVLEVLKGYKIKRTLLFKIEHVLGLNNEEPVWLLKTLMAVEKHARKQGWEGPHIKPPEKEDQTEISEITSPLRKEDNDVKSKAVRPVSSLMNSLGGYDQQPATAKLKSIAESPKKLEPKGETLPVKKVEPLPVKKVEPLPVKKLVKKLNLDKNPFLPLLLENEQQFKIRLEKTRTTLIESIETKLNSNSKTNFDNEITLDELKSISTQIHHIASIHALFLTNISTDLPTAFETLIDSFQIYTSFSILIQNSKQPNLSFPIKRIEYYSAMIGNIVGDSFDFEAKRLRVVKKRLECISNFVTIEQNNE